MRRLAPPSLPPFLCLLPSFTPQFLSLPPSLTLPSRPTLPCLIGSQPEPPHQLTPRPRSRPRPVVTQQLKKSLCGAAIVTWRLIYGICGRRMRGALAGDTQEGHAAPRHYLLLYLVLILVHFRLYYPFNFICVTLIVMVDLLFFFFRFFFRFLLLLVLLF